MKTVKATVSRDQLDKADVSVTFKMTFKEWRDLAEKLSSEAWPEWKFRSLISEALRDIISATDRVTEPSEQESPQ